MNEVLKKAFKNQKININSQKIELFSLFFDILMQENKKINLTRIVEKNDVAKNHFLDSIISQQFIPQKAKIIDVGAGAGFPCIPLKIVRQDLNFVMVDSVRKKTDFLNRVVKHLNLTNIVAIHSRSEDLAQDEKFRETFDICVSRAVAELNTLCEYCLPFVKQGGLFIAYKSVDSQREIERAKNAIKKLGGELIKIYFYSIDKKRTNCLIVIKKTGRTPKQFPRRNNKPRKEPIL